MVTCTLAGLFWFGAWLANWRLNRAAPPAPAPVPAGESVSSEPAPRITTARPWPRAESAPAVAASEPAPALPWAERRDAVLTSSSAITEKAEQLLELLPRLDAADQEEAARHTVNLLSDEHFPAAGAFLTNAAAPEAVQNIFMADLLNRPEKVKLPFWLAIARTPEHPRAAEALKLLSLHFTEDHGSNWPAWEEAVQAKGQTNP